MKEMFRDVIQQVMEVEMDEELGRERCQRAVGNATAPNYRNGYSQKTIKTQLGEIDIKIPRDRQGNYEPKIMEVTQRSYAMPRHGGQDPRLVRLRHEPAGYC